MPAADATYVATARVDPTDDDWQARIATHRRTSPAGLAHGRADRISRRS